MKNPALRLTVAGSIIMLSPSPALAQRTDDNATKDADDAFGKSVGGEQIGIYNPYDVRGFSPVDAGNLRIEGLYFDQQANPTDRLIDGSTVHVGISAQGYPFPAPTGIADYALRKPGKDFIASVGLNYGPFGGKSAELDVQLPLDGDRLGIAFGTGLYRDTNPVGGTAKDFSVAATGRFAPGNGVEIMPFWSRIITSDEESQPLIFTSGNFLPKRYRRGQFFGQKWADFAGNRDNYGIVAKAKPFGLEASFGIFRSVNDGKEDHVDLLFDTDRTGRVGDRVVIALGANRFASTSGEFRLAKRFADGPRSHMLIGSVKARQQARRYGGEDVFDLGVSQIGVEDFRPEPVASYGSKTLDNVSQQTFGLGYRGIWKNVGELSVGLQKSVYQKSITNPNPAVVLPDSKSKPILFSANLSIFASDAIAFYGGYARGLEESPVAPTNATNINEAPPAILTTQKEAGVRWKVSDGVSMVVGVFDIEKPYFNLDQASKFRQLGTVRNRGVEFSLAGQIAPGLSVVIGNIMLDATVSGEEVRLGLIGKKPVGTFVRHTIASIDYQLPWVKSVSVNLGFEATSDRAANAANTFVIPARSVTSLGARYRFKIGDAPVLLRATVGNIFNKFGWNVGGSGFFIPNGTRRFALSLAADL